MPSAPRHRSQPRACRRGRTAHPATWFVLRYLSRLPVHRVAGAIGGDLRLEHLAHPEQFLLGHDQVAALLAVILVKAGLHDRVHRAGLLAEAAEDALGEIDVVARGAAGAVGALPGLDGDGHRRAHRLAQLAGDAATLAVGIAAQSVQAAEARRLRRLLLRILDGDLAIEKITSGEAHALEQLPQEQAFDEVDDGAHVQAPPENHGGTCSITSTATTTSQTSVIGRNTFHPSRMI